MTIIPGDDNQKDSFINDDQAADSSIGSGTSDQGIEPGDEDDDEFSHDITGLPEGASKSAQTDNPLGKMNESGVPSKRPTHGLSEEGPGPDS
ncbi:MAG: hypothetical protein WKF89_13380 [Chitinophagaceae bacterium]